MSAELRNEMGGILKRWESARIEEEADRKKTKKKRPLINSYEWGWVEKGSKKKPHS